MRDLSRCSICGERLGEYEIHTEYYSLIEDNKKVGDLGGFICLKCAIKESGIEELYHISNDCDILDTFVPRIPENRAKGEDDSTPRISLSSSIEGCLSAVPWGGINLDEYFYDGEKSFLLRVYEFDLSDMNISNIVPPEYLYYKDLVRDAFSTKEYWYTNKMLHPSRSYLIEINDYKDDDEDNVVCQEMMDLIRAERNREECSINYEDIIRGHYAVICDVTYSIVPEERRSGVFRLNHKIKRFKYRTIESVKNDTVLFNTLRKKAILDVETLYPNARTWADIEERNGDYFLIGELDTRMEGEIDTNNIINYINEDNSAIVIKNSFLG